MPAIIFQNQALLDVLHPSTIVIPLTSRLIDDIEPLKIRVKACDLLKKDSDVLVDQICSIDNKNLIQGPLTKCDKAFMDKVYDAVMQVMGRL
jgi:mRNA interferase MazF